MSTSQQHFGFTYDDLQQITGLTKSGVSQHVCRGNLDATDLVSVCAFIARYGKPEIRLEIMQKMMGIDRQTIERSRPQSTVGVPREDGKIPGANVPVRKGPRPPKAAR